MDKILQKHLKKQSLEAELLFAKASGCMGEACAKVLRAQCGGAVEGPGAAARPVLSMGKLLGGRIYRTANRTTSRFRLWLHDMSSGQTAYSDTYCQDCNLIYALPTAVDALLGKPRVRSSSPGASPLYCQGERSESSSPVATHPRPSLSRYLIAVHGEGKHQKAVLAGMKPLMRQALLPVEYIKDLRGNDPAELRRLVGTQRDAQVLGVELNREGGATLWLYDSASEKTQSVAVECAGCEAEELLRKLDNALTPLLSHCFDGACLGAGSKPYPEEACAPLEEASCSDADLFGNGTGSGRRYIDKKTATLVKAGLWGGVALSAATAIGLAIANPLVSREVQGYTYRNTLTAPAWAMAGLSAALLTIAIPTTIVVQRAQRASESSGGDLGGSAAMQCPQ